MTGPFDGIVGQPRATGALASALLENRLFPSMIFHGPSGVGKLATSVALARILLCPSGDARACGSCPSCRRVDERALLHPDVFIALPEKLSEFRKGDVEKEGVAALDLQEMQSRAVANPAWQVLIDRMRRCIGLIQRAPGEGVRSILIIDQAHRMAAPAANALLKTLEEPPAHAVIVLLTSSYHALLPTIRSRCRSVPFQFVPRADIATTLETRHGVDPEEAVLRAGLSGGRIGEALALDLEDYRVRREDLLQSIETVLERRDPGVAVARAEAVARRGDDLEGDLQLILTLLRDMMVLGSTSGENRERLIHVDLAGRLRTLAARAPGIGPGAVEEVESTLTGVRHSGNRLLLVENLFLSFTSPPRGADRRTTA